jgi:hypothetical protein
MRKSIELNFMKWNRWQKSLKLIRIALQNLDGSRRIYSEFLDILKNNKKLHKFLRHPFFEWISKNYAVSSMVGIRRLVDERSNELNLYKLLLDIEKNTQQITIDNYVRSFFPYDRNFSKEHLSQYRKANYYRNANSVFEEAFGRPRRILMLRDIEKDKQIVEGVAKDIIENFVSKHIVHFDKKINRDKRQTPTSRLVHRCLDTLMEIYNKYALLLRGEKLSSYKQTLVSLWDEPFHLPWIE